MPHLPHQAPWTTGPTAEASPWASFPHCQVPLETHVGLTGRKSPPGTTVKGVRLQGHRPAHLGRPPAGGCSGPGAATAQGPPWRILHRNKSPGGPSVPRRHLAVTVPAVLTRNSSMGIVSEQGWLSRGIQGTGSLQPKHTGWRLRQCIGL